MATRKESVSRGQKVWTGFPRDSSNYKGDGTLSGLNLGGGDTNLSHSLNGTSAHVDGTGHGKKDKFD